MDDYLRLIAEESLGLGAIKLNPARPFQWASGYRMPIYNDNRLFLSNPVIREDITDAFLKLIEENFPRAELVIAGTSTAGIPWATLISDRRAEPMIYIRDKPKDHGLRNQIEGIASEKDLSGQTVVLIEDLISTGGSSVSAVQAIRDAKGECNHCFSLFSYGFDQAEEMFRGKIPFDKEKTKYLSPPCQMKSLLTYEDLIEAAKQTGYLNSTQISQLNDWRMDPFNWGEKNGFPKFEKK